MSAQDSSVVGIDLGTVFSVVAHLDDDGKPVSIQNAEGDILTPSVVMFDKSGVVVGKEALKGARQEPDRVAAFAKREMGEPCFSQTIAGRQLPPEVIQSFVLAKLRADAELKLGIVKKAVITVPAYFNEPRRKATQDAGRLAGLDVIDIINEPTAAAVAFGVQHGFLTQRGEARQKETILVYDLGGGTFDATVMAIDGVDYVALATAGDVFLGGADFDERIADYVAGKFQDKHGLDPREDAKARQRLRQEAEDAKRTLTAREEVAISFEFRDHAVRVPLSRKKFEELTADLLERTRFTARRVIKEAGLEWKDLTRVLLAGGSTRMPMVQKMLEEESGRKPDRSISADEAVAHGAAIYAGMLMAIERGELAHLSVTNVNSHNLGVLGIEPGTGRPRVKVLIPRNTALPATQKKRFVTHQENQRSVSVPVVEGGDASGNNATHIGKCVVRGLPKSMKKGSDVEVAFTYTQSGRLTVDAHVPGVKHDEATMTIERAAGLGEEQLAEWQRRIDEGFMLDDLPQAAPLAKAVDPHATKTFAKRELPTAVSVNEEPEIVEDDLFPDDMFPSEDRGAGEAVDDDLFEGDFAWLAQEGRKNVQNAGQASEFVIEGVAPEEEEKVDPDDDALGNFLKNL